MQKNLDAYYMYAAILLRIHIESKKGGANYYWLRLFAFGSYIFIYHEYVGHGLGEQVCAGPSISTISSSE